jgi:uncharacterized protein (TIGR03086 family)
MLDLEPATQALSQLVTNVRDDQLDAPTPCSETTLGGLLDHVDGLSQAFTAAATKSGTEASNAGPSADASRLGTDWRERIPQRLAGLAAAWRNESAWSGMTKAGGQDLPAELAGVIALNEVIVHSWDIAAASGQPFDCDTELVEAAAGFVQPTASQNPEGVPGLFGPAVAVPNDAPPLDRLVGLTGRHPQWGSTSRT